MALAISPQVPGPSFALSTALCSKIQMAKGPSVALAFCPLASHIKYLRAEHVSMKSHACHESNAAAGQWQTCFLEAPSQVSIFSPSGRTQIASVQGKAAGAVSEGQSSQGMAESM
jgi:hypothetical protein